MILQRTWRTPSGVGQVWSSVVGRKFIFTVSCLLSQSHVYSHVVRTGDIKDFVITEESGIAKGIRRIVGVTGNEARNVIRIAEALKMKLDALEIMDEKGKDAGLKAFSVVRKFILSKRITFYYSFVGTWTSRYFRY